MKIYHILIFLMLFACSENSSQQEEVKENHTHETPFEEFISKIPAYDFPVKMTCNFDRLVEDKAFTDYLNFYPEQGRLIAKLNSSSEYALVIFDFACDYSCPILYSYDKKGDRIDSLNLTPGQCAEDPFLSSRNWFIINEDINIELVDTSDYFSKGDNKLMDSTTIEMKSYKLNSDGHFETVTHTIETFLNDSTKQGLVID
ncbi:hypothetical protein K6119_08205 [Paracrocinitomix mangrovi]|uniref:hypothetical protein n=1 Tax=Paracrocinitomix mangrovi TaxID=2862509 RepID=UPI001C8D3FA6|nr:hypothetical protein [Paracrocinitomix mangrovi]UKN03495.1 hypothetical protein K6119_08205 [Paracrocinitomix mangrovi]